MSAVNCPNCGDTLPRLLDLTKMVDCESCGTTVILDGDALQNAGQRGEMLDAPSLITLNTPVRIKAKDYTPVGHMRFDYGAGWWDEYWCLDPFGAGVWLSADEGDYVFEHPLDRSLWPMVQSKSLEFNGVTYVVSEKDSATCVAFRGQLPEVITLGETHHYTSFVSDAGKALTREHWTENGKTQEAWFAGEWLDPWSIGAQA